MQVGSLPAEPPGKPMSQANAENQFKQKLITVYTYILNIQLLHII